MSDIEKYLRGFYTIMANEYEEEAESFTDMTTDEKIVYLGWRLDILDIVIKSCFKTYYTLPHRIRTSDIIPFIIDELLKISSVNIATRRYDFILMAAAAGDEATARLVEEKKGQMIARMSDHATLSVEFAKKIKRRVRARF